MQNVRKKRLVWVVATIIGIPMLLHGLATAYFVFVPSAEDYAHRTAFDPAGWRGRSLDTDPQWPTRLRMVNDLLAKKRLDGLTRREVESLLGSSDRTDKWKEWHLVYHLGPERRGLFRIDSEWLVIRFGRSERVEEYRIVGD